MLLGNDKAAEMSAVRLICYMILYKRTNFTFNFC